MVTDVGLDLDNGETDFSFKKDYVREKDIFGAESVKFFVKLKDRASLLRIVG